MGKAIRGIKKVYYNYPKLTLFITMLIISALPILWLKSPIFTDETGTIGSVAFLSGYDWSVLISGNGNYYKCGQALLYYPVFLLFHSPEAIYKGILFLNAVLISCIPILAYMILNKFLNHKNSNELFLMSLIIGVMPAILLNSKYCWAESILSLLPWLIAYILLKLSYINITEVQKKNYSMGLAVFSVYAFMSHQRGIVIVIATLMMVLFMRFYLRKDMINYRYFLVTLFGMLMLDHFIGVYFENALFGIDGVKANTIGTSLDLEYLFKIFTYPGMSVLMKEIIGWLFAFFVSTYGLGTIALVIIIFFVIEVTRKRFDFQRIGDKKSILLVFSILIFIGSFVLGILFFYKAAYLYYNEMLVTRADRMIYTRYMDSTHGLICLVGLLGLYRYKKAIINKVSCALFLCVLIVSSLYILPKLDNKVLWTHTISYLQFVDMNHVSLGLGVSENLSCDIGYIMVDNLSVVLLITSIIALVVLIIIIKTKRSKASLIIILCVYLLGYVGNLKKFTIPISQYYYSLVQDIEMYIDYIALDSDFKDLYVDEDIIREAIQFHFPKFNVYTARNEGELPANMLVISTRNSNETPVYDTDFHYFTNVNAKESLQVYIKGEELNDYLNEKGVETY